jgi:hypothetical protein
MERDAPLIIFNRPTLEVGVADTPPVLGGEPQVVTG